MVKPIDGEAMDVVGIRVPPDYGDGRVTAPGSH